MQIKEAFKGKVLVFTGGTGSFDRRDTRHTVCSDILQQRAGTAVCHQVRLYRCDRLVCQSGRAPLGEGDCGHGLCSEERVAPPGAGHRAQMESVF